MNYGSILLGHSDDNTRLELTRSEVIAVMDYIFQHSRTSPNSKAYKVWVKMFEWLDGEREFAENSVRNNELFTDRND